MGGETPKQLLDLGGRSLLQRSIAAFDAHAAISQLVVVLPEEFVSRGVELIGPTTRACTVVAGGSRRQDSVTRGAAALSDSVDVVLIHDAARPFVDAPLIDRVLEAVATHGAAVPCIRVRDTVKRVTAETGQVSQTIPRDDLWLAQTPQGFLRRVLDDVMALGATGVTATDEAMLAERAGHPVRVVQGDERNVKITTPEDLAQARASVRPASRVGTGYDLHRLVEGRPFVLAGVVIPFERGPLGHSDADVVCHAVVDALFGAAGAGDIGRHFPDTDPAWKGAPGLDLLARAVAIIGGLGWAVSNVDVTVIVERPKLAPHIDSIRERLAAVLGVAIDRVSVKGKTNEGVDAVGRGEAIASHAIAVISGPTGPAGPTGSV
jgi:2-C-methyl-D-erythritol 4-phosphate cytidylyltransferase/2-C-methyl-D-erythritol 2,4-cyclodiphosphate synthase